MSWEATARRQGGAVSHAQLRESGAGRDAIAAMCRTGRLRRRSRGVYLAGAAPVTYESALWIAVLGTRGVLGFRTAAHLWELIDDPGERIDVIVDASNGYRGIGGVRVHRVQSAAKSITRRHGLPITNRTCSALDHLGRLSRADAIRFADRALQRSWLTRHDIERRLENQPGRTGNGRLREVFATTVDGAAAESERVLHRLLRQSGIDGWVPNHGVRLSDGLFVVIDVAFPALGIAVEVDGMAFHTSPERFQSDRTKQNRLVEAGWVVLRLTWSDLVERPDYVIGLIRRAIVGR